MVRGMDEHVCDPNNPDCAAYLHYSDPADRQSAEGAKPRRRRDQPRLLDRHVPIRFKAEVIEQAKAVAEAEGLTVSSWIRRLVERELGPRRPAGTYNDGAGRSHFTITP